MIRWLIIPAAIALIGILMSWWLAAGICLGLALAVGLALAAILRPKKQG